MNNGLQERLKKEEELDRQLKEREKKEKAATKRKHMEIRFNILIAVLTINGGYEHCHLKMIINSGKQ